MIAESILHAIGRTPLVRLRRIVEPGSADVLVKLEYYNPTGSYKDRMALAMIEGAEARGTLRPGMRVVEFTGGSTGSSLALVCAVKGYRFVAVSSDAFAKEKLDTMRAFGADLHVVASEGGRITPGLFDRMRAEVVRLQEEPGTFWTDQFHNEDAITGYMGIGRELVEQTGGVLHAFCGAVGTAGMLTGVSKALKAGAVRRASSRSSLRRRRCSPKGTAGRIASKGSRPASCRRISRRACMTKRAPCGRRRARDGAPAREGRRRVRRHLVRAERRRRAEARAGAGARQGRRDRRGRLRPEVPGRRPVLGLSLKLEV